MPTMTEEQCSGPVLGPGRSRRSFPKEFKADAVALVLDEGRSIASVARSLGIGATHLGNWVRQARVDRGEREGLTSGERAKLARVRRENAQLPTGARSAQRCDGLLGGRVGTVTRYRWVAARRAERFLISMCCRAARVSRQAFYGWRAKHLGGPTDRERAEAALVGEIREIHTGSGGTYGSPQVTAELRSRGHRVNTKRVARLMRAHRITGVRPRRPKRTTTPARSAPDLPDLVGRQFAVGVQDRAWVSDITYVRTGQGWLYLAVVLDLGSRRLLGCQMSDRIDTQLVADALDMTAGTRHGRTAGIIFHSDRGSQYLAGRLQ